MELNEQNVKVLRHAIIEQAIRDFIMCKRCLYKIENYGYRNKTFKKEEYEDILDDAIDFFYSDWFTYLCPHVNPQRIIDKLDAEFDEWKRALDNGEKTNVIPNWSRDLRMLL